MLPMPRPSGSQSPGVPVKSTVRQPACMMTVPERLVSVKSQHSNALRIYAAVTRFVFVVSLRCGCCREVQNGRASKRRSVLEARFFRPAIQPPDLEGTGTNFMRPHITGSRSLRVQTDIGRPIAVSISPKTDIPVNGRFAPQAVVRHACRHLRITTDSKFRASNFLARGFATAGACSIGGARGRVGARDRDSRIAWSARPAFYPVRRETAPMPTP